jgi:hypothetical protein
VGEEKKIRHGTRSEATDPLNEKSVEWATCEKSVE